MDIVISLAQQLFDGQRRSLARQIKRLQATLETLDLQDVQEDEREIIQRILAVLQGFADASDLELDGAEVGEVLNSLIRQREDVENHKRITVTGPESLDGLQKDIIYYLGVDEHRVPRASGDQLATCGDRYHSESDSGAVFVSRYGTSRYEVLISDICRNR